MKKQHKIRITENQLHQVINESVRRVLREMNEPTNFYAEEDMYGNTGKPGQVKSYEIGYYTLENAELDAQDNGYDDVGEYLKYWFDETYPHEFTWQSLGGGYGFHGTTLFEQDGLVIKEIYGQIMIDEREF